MAYGDVVQPDQPVGSYQGPDGQWRDAQGNPIAAPNSTGNVSASSAPLPPGTTVGTGRTFPNEFPLPAGSQIVDQNTGQTQGVGQGAPPPTGGGGITPFSGVNYPQFTAPALPDALKTPFSLPTADDLIKNDPGYMARYQQGLDANQRGAAAQGTLLNGGTQKALAQYGQDYASSEYNNYVQQLLGTRQQQSSDYLNLAYGPAWQQNQAAVNQYGNLYQQYKDLITNNRNQSNDYIDALIRQEQIGSTATAPPPSTSTSNV